MLNPAVYNQRAFRGNIPCKTPEGLADVCKVLEEIQMVFFYI